MFRKEFWMSFIVLLALATFSIAQGTTGQISGTVTDPNGNATNYTYDANGRVLTAKVAGDTALTQYVYVSGGCTSCARRWMMRRRR